MKKTCLILFCLSLLVSAPVASPAEDPQRTSPPPLTGPDNRADDARTILERYRAAWEAGAGRFELPQRTVLIFRISGTGGGDFNLLLSPGGGAVLAEGLPEKHDGGFRTDIETLRRLDRGEINHMTAMGRANWQDPAAMDPILPPGVKPSAEVLGRLLPLAFHFWNREHPVSVRFGEGTSRLVHGGNATVIHYDRGLRSAWYQLEAGMHINAEPADQVNPFASLFIVIRGSCQARLNGESRVLHEGMALVVPAGMSHEFWAGPGEYAEFIMICWGEGA